MLVDVFTVVVSEMAVDWIKHAFITKFNELPIDIYKDYTYSLAYDIAQTHQRHVRQITVLFSCATFMLINTFFKIIFRRSLITQIW